MRNLRIHFPSGNFNDLTCNDIEKESLTLTENLCSKKFQLGMAESPVIKFTTMNVGNITGEEIECYMEEIVPEGTEGAEYKVDIDAYVTSIQLGTFIVSEAKKQVKTNQRKVVAYGASAYSEWEFPACELFKMDAEVAGTSAYTVDAVAYMWESIGSDRVNARAIGKSGIDVTSALVKNQTCTLWDTTVEHFESVFHPINKYTKTKKVYTYDAYYFYLGTATKADVNKLYYVDYSADNIEELKTNDILPKYVMARTDNFKIGTQSSFITVMDRGCIDKTGKVVDSINLLSSENSLHSIPAQDILFNPKIDGFATAFTNQKNSWLEVRVVNNLKVYERVVESSGVATNIQDPTELVADISPINPNLHIYQVDKGINGRYGNITVPRTRVRNTAFYDANGGVSNRPTYKVTTLPMDLISNNHKNIQAMIELDGNIAKMDRQGEWQFIRLDYEHTKSIDAHQTSSVLYDDEYSLPYGAVKAKFVPYNASSSGITQLESTKYIEGFSSLTDKATYQVYDISNNYWIKNNTFENATIEDILNRIGEAIKDVRYMPCTIKMKGDLDIEPSDVVDVDTGEDSFRTIVMKRTITGIQSLKDTIEAK